ncbi:MAG: hypothetical protein AAF518_25620 [Spirochaetota bacterium]
MLQQKQALEKRQTDNRSINFIYFDLLETIVKSLSINENVAKRLIRNLEYIDYIKDDAISEKGEKAVTTGEIFVPQAGLWEIFYIEDERISNNTGFQILEIKEYKEDRRNDNNQEKITQKTPSFLKELIDIEQKIGNIQQHPKCDIRVIEEKCLGLRQLPSEVKLKLNLENTASEGQIIYSNTKVTFDGFTNDSIWQELQQCHHPFFDKYENETYLVPFSSLKGNKQALQDFLYDFIFATSFSSDLLGEVQKIQFKATPIFPESDADANEWYQYLLIDSIQDYLWEDEYEALNQKITYQFPNRNIAPMLRETLRKNLWKNRSTGNLDLAKVWFLNAPADLEQINL